MLQCRASAAQSQTNLVWRLYQPPKGVSQERPTKSDAAAYGLTTARLILRPFRPNDVPSLRVAEKNGMSVERGITFRGFPTLVYAMTREQWLAKRGAA